MAEAEGLAYVAGLLVASILVGAFLASPFIAGLLWLTGEVSFAGAAMYTLLFLVVVNYL